MLAPYCIPQFTTFMNSPKFSAPIQTCILYIDVCPSTNTTIIRQCHWFILFIHSFITNISPRNLYTPQMRKCNIGSIYQIKMFWTVIFWKSFCSSEESFNLAGRSFQIVGPETLNDLGSNVIVLVLGMYSCSDAADSNFIIRPGHRRDCDTVSGQVGWSPNRSNTGASKWRSWRLSFVAEVTNG